VGVGAALPAGRLAVADVAAAWGQGGGRGTLAVCGPDEDALTLGWAAAEAALAAAGLSPDDVGGLWWGTARPPLPEGPSWAYLATAIGLSQGVAGLLAGGSTHAGLDALGAAWDALAAGAVERALVVASDALVPGEATGAERSTGAGAVALLLARPGRGEAAGRLVRRAGVVRPLLDRYRGEGQDGTGDPYDPRLFRDRELLPLAKAAAAALGAVPEGARWSVPDPDGRLGRSVAKAAGAAEVASDGVQSQVGDSGSAAPFLGAVRAMTSGGPICLLGVGGGRATAVLIELDGALPGAAEAAAALEGGDRGTKPVSYAAVLRARGQLVPASDPIPMGVPPGSAAFVRGGTELLALQGRRCPSCGTLAVPPSIHPVCPTCGTLGGEIVGLARAGRVHTFVVNHTMPAPFEAPLPLAVVDLDDGARVMLQGLPEDAAAMAVGDRVRLELRRYATERGAPVYGFKVVREAGASGDGGQDGPAGTTVPAPSTREA
jgi:3-hydroxy-3-methylglutaryl CoA synthase/uncharacterized OB-fold protein